MKWKTLIPDIVSLLFILLWVYAAASKILTFEKFHVQLGQSPLLTPFAKLVSVAVPLAELALALLLFFNRTKYLALMASFSLMLFFTFYIVAITRFSDHVPCSCGGVLQKLDWDSHLIFNIVFVILAFIAAILHYLNVKTEWTNTNLLSIKQDKPNT